VRSTIQGAIKGTVDTMLNFHKDLHGPQQRTEEEALDRYVRRHRGRVVATVDFARRHLDPDADVWTEAKRYEDKMEALLRRRDNGN
jgi:hypothetical protein